MILYALILLEVINVNVVMDINMLIINVKVCFLNIYFRVKFWIKADRVNLSQSGKNSNMPFQVSKPIK